MAASVPPAQIDLMQPGDQALARTVAVETGSDVFPVSLYPYSTRQDLCLLLLATAMFVLGMKLFRDGKSQLALCVLCLVNGTALAFFGLVQQLSWNGQLFWSVPIGQGIPFASFINRNNAAGFLNLCLAGAVGLVAYILATRKRRDASSLQMDQESTFLDYIRMLLRRCMMLVADLDGAKLAVFAGGVMILTGVLCSLSRGGWLAAAAAFALSAFVISYVRKAKIRPWLLITVLLGSVAFVAWVGKSEIVANRLGTLLNHKTVTANERLPHWQDALATSKDYWRTGSGLGSYRYIYRLYQDEPNASWFYHAENQYIEAFVEGGIVGFGLMLAMIGLTALASVRLIIHDDPATHAFGIATLFALTSQVVHAFVDFGLYIPSNMLLFALMCGAVAGQAAQLESLSVPHVRRFLSVRLRGLILLPSARSIPASVVALLVVGVGFGLLQTQRLAARDAGQAMFRVGENDVATDREEVRRAIASYETAVGRLDDPTAQLQLASMWLRLYRADIYASLRATEADTISSEILWRSTNLTSTHAWAHERRAQHRQDLENLQRNALVTGAVHPALQHLVRARLASPLFSRVHLTLGQLSFATGEPKSDKEHLQRVRLTAAAWSTDTLLRCGLLELQAGRTSEAIVAWRRCIELSPESIRTVLNLAHRLDSNQLSALLPDAPQALVVAAKDHLRGDRHAELRSAALSRAEKLIQSGNLPEDESYYLLAVIHATRDQTNDALPLLSQAIQLRPQSAAWRCEYALLLQNVGRNQEAYEQLSRCVGIDPSNQRYTSLLNQINTSQVDRPEG